MLRVSHSHDNALGFLPRPCIYESRRSELATNTCSGPEPARAGPRMRAAATDQCVGARAPPHRFARVMRVRNRSGAGSNDATDVAPWRHPSWGNGGIPGADEGLVAAISPSANRKSGHTGAMVKPDSHQGGRYARDALDAENRRNSSLDRSVILLNDGIEVLAPSDTRSAPGRVSSSSRPSPDRSSGMRLTSGRAGR